MKQYFINVTTKQNDGTTYTRPFRGNTGNVEYFNKEDAELVAIDILSNDKTVECVKVFSRFTGMLTAEHYRKEV